MDEKIVKEAKDIVNDCISRRQAVYVCLELIHERRKWLSDAGQKEISGIDVAMCAIQDLPSAQPEQQWIPCSERLPEHGGRYLISVLDGINRRTTVAPYLPRCKAWTMTGRMAYWKVIAWMPLPEPYKEDDHETD